MKRILVALDFSDVTPLVVETAVRLALDSTAGICLLHVGPPREDFFGQQLFRRVVKDDVPEELREAHAALQHLETRLRGRGLDVETLLVEGKAIESILEEARLAGAHLIVMGAHRRSGLSRILGSVSGGVLRGATCPVLIVPAAAVTDE